MIPKSYSSRYVIRAVHEQRIGNCLTAMPCLLSGMSLEELQMSKPLTLVEFTNIYKQI